MPTTTNGHVLHAQATGDARSRARLPLRGGANPASARDAAAGRITTPGSFANAPAHHWDARGALTFASPDTPNMPAPSEKTAWDFLPEGWSVVRLGAPRPDQPAWVGDVESANPHVAQRTRALDVNAPGCAACLSDRRAFVEFNTSCGERVRVLYPRDFRPITQLEHARLGIVTPQMRAVCEPRSIQPLSPQGRGSPDEVGSGEGSYNAPPHPGFRDAGETHLTPERIRDEIAAGRMILPANITHLSYNLRPMVIGRAAKTKINANMGASPVSSGTHEEVEKLKWAERWGADTVMDLSTGGNLDECRGAILRASTVPIGTVPIYSMIIGRKIEDLTREVILETLCRQAAQGVDYFTIHAGVLKEHLPLIRDRLIGIVSRGGSLLAKWCLVHGSDSGGEQNPMYTHFDEICDVMREFDVSFSLGDGLRPGGLADATDAAQLAELQTLGELTESAWRKGCQVMVEGPGHVPFDQIEFNMKAQRALCHGAPFYVLGPLVTDVFPGYDHITSCIGATSAGYHGASMLCYVTPKEHLGLPKKDDVKQGCIAYKIAAHAADVALGIPGVRAWDDNLTRARAALNWEKHFELSFDPDTARAYHDEDLDVDTDFCAMCGHDWCSVRISKEIQEFASGKADGFERNAEESSWGAQQGKAAGAPVKTAALTIEQQDILAKRGVLSPDEIHALAAKTKKAMTDATVSAPSNGAPSASEAAAEAKLSCHSDYVDPDTARRMHATTA